MDFLKDFPAVVTAVAGVIGTVLGFFLGRWNSVENRNFIRRAAVYDMRIQEAREVLEKFNTTISLIWEYLRLIDEENDMKTVTELMSFHEDDFQKIPSLMMDAFQRKSSIDLLNDKKLSDLMDLFLDTLTPIGEKILAVDYGVIDAKYDEVERELSAIEKYLERGEETPADKMAEIIEAVDDLKIKAKIDIRDFKKGIDFNEIREGLKRAKNIIIEMKARLDILASHLK